MRKILIVTMVLMVILFCSGVLQDLETLHQGVIRLHVVGASNSEQDQNAKLAVKDAVNYYLHDVMQGVSDQNAASGILTRELSNLKTLAEQVLRQHGIQDPVQITLEQEAFPRRDYDTFSLPSGVYESLRIRIGEAEGRNWWCVVFPSLCLPAAGEDLRDTAAGAGFSDTLSNTLTGEAGYEIRFFFLDWLGQIQNFWFQK